MENKTQIEKLNDILNGYVNENSDTKLLGGNLQGLMKQATQKPLGRDPWDTAWIAGGAFGTGYVGLATVGLAREEAKGVIGKSKKYFKTLLGAGATLALGAWTGAEIVDFYKSVDKSGFQDEDKKEIETAWSGAEEQAIKNKNNMQNKWDELCKDAQKYPEIKEFVEQLCGEADENGNYQVDFDKAREIYSFPDSFAQSDNETIKDLDKQYKNIMCKAVQVDLVDTVDQYKRENDLDKSISKQASLSGGGVLTALNENSNPVSDDIINFKNNSNGLG